MTKIAILDDYQNVALQTADWSAVQARADVIVFNDHVADAEALVARLEPFDAICVMRGRTPLPRSVLERLPSLRFIASTGARNASIDLEAARDFTITVSSTGANGSGAPELTWALILAAARQIPAEVQSLQSGGWQTTVGRDLNGSTLGIIGLGRIGSQIARVGTAFGMNVICMEPEPDGRNGPSRRHHPCKQGGAASEVRLGHPPSRPLRSLKRCYRS